LNEAITNIVWGIAWCVIFNIMANNSLETTECTLGSKEQTYAFYCKNLLILAVVVDLITFGIAS